MTDFIDEIYTDKDLSLLKKLTLIIPTYDRNFYLSRCLWYHAHFPFAEIIVADSSSKIKKTVNQETIQKIREKYGTNIRYLEYEPESEKYGGDIYRKWGDAVQHVDTEYSQICADKEFLIPTTQCACIEFLDINTDYSIAEGMDYHIQSYLNDNMNFYPWQGESSFDMSDPLERIQACFVNSKIVGTLFSVQRAILQKKIYANLLKYNIWDIRFGEISLEYQPLVLGKMKKFSDYPANCRDCTHTYKYSSIKTITNKSDSSFVRYPLLIDYPPKIYESLYNQMELCFKNLLQEHVSIPNSNYENTFYSILIQLMKKRYFPTSPLMKKSKILRRYYAMLPINLKNLLSKKMGYGNVIETPVQMTEVLACISSIITITDINYDTDTPTKLISVID